MARWPIPAFLLAALVLGSVWRIMPAQAQRPDPGLVEADRWLELPTQVVEGRTDLATTSFAARPGATSVRIKALGGEVRLSRIELVLVDGSTQQMGLRNVIGAGEEAGPILLPKLTKAVKEMRIHVLATSPLGENRRIAVAASGGRDASAATEAAPATPPGWIAIAVKRSTLGQRRETISIGRDKGRLAAIALRPRDGAINLREIRVVYGNGETMTAGLVRRIEQDGLTPPLAVDREQTIHQVHITFDVPDGVSSGRPLLELLAGYVPDYYGDDGQVIAVNGGWLLLGVQTASMFKADSDYKLGERFGSFSRLRLRVTNSDAEIRDLYLAFTDGRETTLPVNQILRAGQFSPLIELPKTPEGNKPQIQQLTINRKARSQLRGEAIVEVWGQY